MIEQNDCNISFESVYQSSYCPDDKEIREANLLVLPYENFREGVDYCFTEYGEEFLRYVRENGSDDIKADIAITDDKYCVIEMHSVLIDIGRVLLSSCILPMAINLLSNYVYDKIKSLHAKEEDVNIRCEFISQATDGSSKKIRYDGPASGFAAVKDTADKMLKES